VQKLADYIGLPCRIAQGCKYCVADHRSSCLVKIKDDKQFSRFDMLPVILGLIHLLIKIKGFSESKMDTRRLSILISPKIMSTGNLINSLSHVILFVSVILTSALVILLTM
jgi:hypothetical protein